MRQQRSPVPLPSGCSGVGFAEKHVLIDIRATLNRSDVGAQDMDTSNSELSLVTLANRALRQVLATRCWLVPLKADGQVDTVNSRYLEGPHHRAVSE